MDYAQLREKMVCQQIERRGVKDPAVLKAMRSVPRERFVSHEFLSEAYCDYPLPIGYRQTISQPYIVARMAELLELNTHHKVLEIGAGCGYLSCVLAEITQHLYSVEIIPELALRAKENILRLAYQNIHLRQGDGLDAWKTEAPFDRIIAAAAPPSLPMELVNQLRIGGILVMPIGKNPQTLYSITRKSETDIEKIAISSVAFVPMTGEIKNKLK